MTTTELTPPLKVGLILPETERQMNGGSASWRDLAEMARLGEEIGADSLWFTDHLIHRVPGEEPRGMWECWSLISALAAVTERAEIGTLVLCNSFRNPALLAKMADTVEEISGGRLILGVGAGWNKPEYDAFGYPFDHRAGRFAEALTIISGLLRHGEVDFRGTYHAACDCELRPRGPRRHGPPIMIGSTGERMLRLAARHADIWNAWGKQDPAEIPPLRATVDGACRAEGRDPASMARSVSMLVDLPGAAGRPREEPPFVTGDAETIEGTLRGMAREGIGHVMVVLDPNTVAGIEALAPVLERLDRG